MRIAAVLLLIAASSPAYADDLPDEYLSPSLDPFSQEIYRSIRRQFADGGLRVNASAGVASDLDVPIAGTAAADVGYDLPLCRVVGLGGSAMLGYGEGDRLSSWTSSGSLCLPVPIDTIVFTLTHGVNVRSGLFDAQETVRDRESMWRGDLTMRGWRFSDPSDQLDVLAVNASMDVVSAPGMPEASTLSLGLSTGSWIKIGAGLSGDRAVDVLRVEVENPINSDAEYNSVAFTFIPLRIQNMRLGSHVGVSGAIGAAMSDINVTRTMLSSEPPISVKSANRAYGQLGIETDLGIAVAGVSGTRANHALFGGQIIFDDRLTATLRHEGKQWSARAEGYLARQQVVRVTPGATVGVGGGVFEASYRLDGTLTATLRTEAGRTLTAASAMDPVTAAWDVRATVGLSASYSALFR